MDHKQRSRFGLSAAGLIAACSFVVSSAIADVTASKPDVKEIMGPDGISWDTSTAYKAARLVVSGPGGFRLEQDFAAGDSLFLDFASVVQKSGAPSGQFTYELVFTPFMTAADKALADEARSLGVEASALGAVSISPVSGVFTLDNGNPVDVDLPETTLKDIVHLDDVIIDGSLCVGLDCVNGESFGFDTIRLKENNLRVHFDDTSTSASFPFNEWRIVINDSSNGGASYFGIEDSTAGRSVARIVAGAPSNSLVVDAQGDLGLGTLSPVVELHIVDGDTPTLRLEQNGSSGFTPQTWDVAGNETNFFIRDVTNGSRLPFRIEPGTDTNTLYLDGNDDRVGIGTNTPDGKLDIDNGTSDATLVLSQTGTVDAQWEIKNNEATGRLTFGTIAGGGTQVPFKMDPDADNNLLRVGVVANDRVDITGSLFINNVNNSNPDYVFQPNYDLMSIEEHALRMWQDSHLPFVGKGQVDENGKAVVNVAARSQGILEELEIAHIYIEQLDGRIDSLSSENAALKETLAQARRELETRIAKLESER